MTSRFLTGTLVILTALGGNTALAQEKLPAQCTLTYKPSVNAQGPCTVLQVGALVSIHGTVEENGQTYTATIDNSKNEGLLIGAGTFDLANGKLARNTATEVAWPNGYVLTIKLK